MVDWLRELTLLGQLSPEQQIELSMAIPYCHEYVAIALLNDNEIMLLGFPSVDIADTVNKMLRLKNMGHYYRSQLIKQLLKCLIPS